MSFLELSCWCVTGVGLVVVRPRAALTQRRIQTDGSPLPRRQRAPARKAHKSQQPPVLLWVGAPNLLAATGQS